MKSRLQMSHSDQRSNTELHKDIIISFLIFLGSVNVFIDFGVFLYSHIIGWCYWPADHFSKSMGTLCMGN